MNNRLTVLVLIFFVLFTSNAIAEQIKDGFGKAQLPDSSVYEGEFRNGLFNGKGKLVWRNSDKFEGEFKDGLVNGKGTFVRHNGEIHEGFYKDGLL
ncbi:MAG: hypothetical protein PHI59_09475, partial [Candidatus Omnitrophica bacterium]|nr:hypothetical protein [Candidatus Omnitrophota bacterium]